MSLSIALITKHSTDTRIERIQFVRHIYSELYRYQHTNGKEAILPEYLQVDGLLKQLCSVPRSFNYRLADFLLLPWARIGGRRDEWAAIASLMMPSDKQIPAVQIFDKSRDNHAEHIAVEPFQTAFQPVMLEPCRGSWGFPSQIVGEEKTESYLYYKRILFCLAVIPAILGPGLYTIVFQLLFQSSWHEKQMLLFNGLVFGIFAWALYRVWPAIREELYVVPGSLVARRSSNYARDWKLQRYTPCNSMLFVTEIGLKTTLIIAPAGLHPHVQIRLDRETLQSVLNAWFSPVPPPKEHELADLM
jgi:hypothetical protein